MVIANFFYNMYSNFCNRAQLAIGHREASKCLERDQLALLLVWKDAEPSIITKCLIPLAATRLCPALCLQSLGPKLSLATGLTSAVAVGFKVRKTLFVV